MLAAIQKRGIRLKDKPEPTENLLFVSYRCKRKRPLPEIANFVQPPLANLDIRTKITNYYELLCFLARSLIHLNSYYLQSSPNLTTLTYLSEQSKYFIPVKSGEQEYPEREIFFFLYRKKMFSCWKCCRINSYR